MGTLASDLKEMGYTRTEKESPFVEGARLWSNGVELVCEESAMVIDTQSSSGGGGDDDAHERDYFRYPNSERVRMIGGFMSQYFDEDSMYWTD